MCVQHVYIALATSCSSYIYTQLLILVVVDSIILLSLLQFYEDVFFTANSEIHGVLFLEQIILMAMRLTTLLP